MPDYLDTHDVGDDGVCVHCGMTTAEACVTMCPEFGEEEVLGGYDDDQAQEDDYW